MYGLNPEGKILGGYYDNDKNFGVFGGGVEEGEDPATAGAREFVEEAGYRLKNPRMLPFKPIVFDWKPPYSSPQQAEKAKRFRGSRTFFGVGEVGDPVSTEERGSDTYTGLRNIRFRSPHTALRNTVVSRGLNPEAAKLRRAIYRHLIAQARQRRATVSQES